MGRCVSARSLSLSLSLTHTHTHTHTHTQHTPDLQPDPLDNVNDTDLNVADHLHGRGDARKSIQLLLGSPGVLLVQKYKY